MSTPLADFLAPITPEAILTHRDRRKLPLQAGKCTRWNGDLFSWDRLCAMAADANDLGEVRISSNRNFIPLEFLQTDGDLDRDKLGRVIDRGASVIMESAHRFDDHLAAIVRDYLNRSDKPVRVGAIGSTGKSGALIRHADPIDLFLVQIEGAKHWRIFAPEIDAEDKDGQAGKEANPVFEHTLQAGEFLFVPAGMPHECDTVGGSSLHLGLGFCALNYDVWG